MPVPVLEAAPPANPSAIWPSVREQACITPASLPLMGFSTTHCRHAESPLPSGEPGLLHCRGAPRLAVLQPPCPSAGLACLSGPYLCALSRHTKSTCPCDLGGSSSPYKMKSQPEAGRVCRTQWRPLQPPPPPSARTQGSLLSEQSRRRKWGSKVAHTSHRQKAGAFPVWTGPVVG